MTRLNMRRIKNIEDFNLSCPIGSSFDVIMDMGAVEIHEVLSEAWEIDGEGVALFEGIAAPYPIKKVLVSNAEKNKHHQIV